jgi:hypothetical protein
MDRLGSRRQREGAVVLLVVEKRLQVGPLDAFAVNVQTTVPIVVAHAVLALDESRWSRPADGLDEQIGGRGGGPRSRERFPNELAH